MNSEFRHTNNTIKPVAVSLWLVGLSGAGKTTIANLLSEKLKQSGVFVQTLDGDKVRKGINKDLGFSEHDRNENIRRIAEVSKLFLDCNITTINSFICPTEDIRNTAREIIGKQNFYLIYINAPLEICEQRDPKGLYKKARNGEIQKFTGIDSVFEIPANTDLEIHTDILTIEESVQQILNFLLQKIKK